MYVKDNQWYSTKRLPFPTSVCSTAVVGETCYVLGGIGNDHENCCTTLYATISSLLKEATPPSAAITSEEGHHYQPSRVTLTNTNGPLCLNVTSNPIPDVCFPFNVSVTASNDIGTNSSVTTFEDAGNNNSYAMK